MATNEVHIELAAPPDDDRLPGERRPSIENYSKLVPPALQQRSPEEISAIGVDCVAAFIGEQVKQHNTELGLEDMEQVQPHPLFFSPDATSTASAPGSISHVSSSAVCVPFCRSVCPIPSEC
jgi:hypothetical protein